MEREEIVNVVRAVLDYHLFTLAGTPVTVATVLTFCVIVVVTIWLSHILQRGVEKFFRLRGVTDDGTIGVARRLLHYAVLLVGLGIGLQTIGVNLGALFAAGAVFAVAIGFAMQNVAQNFVSGVILLVERTIKPGDVLEVEGRRVKVSRMGIRATIVRTKDDEDLIVPNSLLVSASVKNYTLRDPFYRLRTTVGVTYDSDMRLVQETLFEAARGLPWRAVEREPEIFMSAFADSSVNFEISVWTTDPWQFQKRVSAINQAIWWALKEKGIVIAFPQLDLHLDRPALEVLGQREPPPAATH